MPRRVSGPVLVGGILLAASLAFAAVAAQRLRNPGHPRVAVMAVEVTASLSTDAVPVTLIGAWKAATLLVAPQWSGLVTAVPLGRGQIVVDGTAVVEVNGVMRFAAQSASPFYRAMRMGDAGQDVAELVAFLARQAFLPVDTQGDQVDRNVMTAIIAFAAAAGVRGVVDAFDPAWVLWLAIPGAAADTIQLATGRATPSPGEPVVVGIAKATSLSFETAAHGPVSLVDAGPWVADIGGRARPVPRGPNDTAIVADEDFDDLTKLGSETTDLRRNGVIRRVNPERVLVVPSSAVLSDSSDRACVIRLAGETGVLVAVTVGRPTLGGVTIASGLSVGDRIEINPRQLGWSDTCTRHRA